MPSFQTSDGLRVVYHIDDYTDPWKKPDVVLMLHSAMGRAHRYYGMAPVLARHFRVVRVDLRGHGETQVPPAGEPLTMERLMQDATELLDHLQVDRAHVVGKSARGY